MSKYRYSLEPLAVLELGGAELVRAAAQTGYDFVSIIAHMPNSQLPLDPSVTDAVARVDMLSAMKETGVRVLNLECFNLVPEEDPASFARALECGAELGAATATAIVWENPDIEDALAKYRRLCDMAAEHGIRVNVEFFATAKTLPSIVEVADFIQRAKRENVGIVLDALHLMRTSGGLAGLAGIDPALIGSVQLSDGMLTLPADPAAEMLSRMLPGEGEFPLREIVEWCPDGLPLSLEAANLSLASTVSAQDRARNMRNAAGAIFD